MQLARLPLVGEGGLLDCLTIRDPRRAEGTRYPAKALLAASLCATLSGCRSFAAITEWIACQPKNLLQLLGFKKAKAPSEKTIRTFLQRIDTDKLSSLIGNWFSERINSERTFACDGKAIRGANPAGGLSLQLVSAVTHSAGITVGQVKVQNGNEVKAIRDLLAALDLDGAIVTLDALHTLKETASLIVHSKNADYVMSLKDNQTSLLSALTKTPAEFFSPSV